MLQERGFTLVELLIALAISAAIFTVVGGMIYQLNMVSDYGNDKLTAWHEMQNFSNRFYLDGYEAVSASAGSVLNFQLCSGQTVTYALSGTNLTRTGDGSSRILARNISGLNFTIIGRRVTLNVASSTPGRMAENETASYMVSMRSISP